MDIDIDIYPYYFRIQNSEIKNFSCLISSIKTAENGLKNGGFQMDCVVYTWLFNSICSGTFITLASLLVSFFNKKLA